MTALSTVKGKDFMKYITKMPVSVMFKNVLDGLCGNFMEQGMSFIYDSGKLLIEAGLHRTILGFAVLCGAAPVENDDGEWVFLCDPDYDGKPGQKKPFLLQHFGLEVRIRVF